MLKNLPVTQETQVQSLGRENPQEKEMATHSSILALETPWTEEPGRLQSMGSQKVRHGWGTTTVFLVYYLSHFTASMTSEENNFLWSPIAMSICVIMVTLTFNIIRCFIFKRLLKTNFTFLPQHLNVSVQIHFKIWGKEIILLDWPKSSSGFLSKNKRHIWSLSTSAGLLDQAALSSEKYPAQNFTNQVWQIHSVTAPYAYTAQIFFVYFSCIFTFLTQ